MQFEVLIILLFILIFTSSAEKSQIHQIFLLLCLINVIFIAYEHWLQNLVNGHVFKGKPMIIQFGRKPTVTKGT